MHWKAVIFDMDGTLLDTLEDIADAANSALEEAGLPPAPVEGYKHFVGDGIRTSLQRAVEYMSKNSGSAKEFTPALQGRLLASFRDHYSRGWSNKTRLYDGVTQMLAGLRAKNIQLNILSNKSQDFVLEIAQKYLNTNDFATIMGQRDGSPQKPDPTDALTIAKKLLLAPEDICFVGDTSTDINTAMNAGMYPVGVTWGFRPEQELLNAGAKKLIHKPLELLEIF